MLPVYMVRLGDTVQECFFQNSSQIGGVTCEIPGSNLSDRIYCLSLLWTVTFNRGEKSTLGTPSGGNQTLFAFSRIVFSLQPCDLAAQPLSIAAGVLKPSKETCNKLQQERDPTTRPYCRGFLLCVLKYLFLFSKPSPFKGTSSSHEHQKI